MNICSFIFTEKGGIAQISNTHLFSRLVFSGQPTSFADFLLVQYSTLVFDASPEGLPLLMAAEVEEPGAPTLTHCAAMGSSLSAGKDTANIWCYIWSSFSCLPASATTT